jgi:hypothetical protein
MRIFEEFDPSAKVMNADLLAEKTGVEKLLLGMNSVYLPAAFPLNKTRLVKGCRLTRFSSDHESSHMWGDFQGSWRRRIHP